MSMQVSIATVEMADGTVHENVRVALQDRLALEKAARANGWKIGDNNYTPSVSAFLAWHASKRQGLIDCSFEDFTRTECNDLSLEQAEAVLGDPTRTEATAV